jgi:signal transduction histidine kinase
LIGRRLALVLLFVIAYLVLDGISYIHPLQTLAITPWNPQPAAAIALLLLCGPQWLGAVFVATLAAEIVVRGAAIPWPQSMLVAAVLALGYGAIARALAGRFLMRPALEDGRDVRRLVGVVVLGTLGTALLYVAALLAIGIQLEDSVFAAVAKLWIGDCVGVLVTLPLIFFVVDARRRATLATMLRRPETLLQLGSILCLLWLVFGPLRADAIKYFYLLFLPLIWITGRQGLAGAVVAVALVQWGLIVAVQLAGAPALTVFELQALQIALAITALFLGVTVDERERAAARLQLSTRLAVAGNMAAALAHELNQPLTALAGYAGSARLLAEMQPLDAPQLEQTLRKVVAEARRAGAVVQRMRWLFEAGAPQREPVDLHALAAEVLEGLQERARGAGVGLHLAPLAAPATLPALDRVQVEVVLRNLLSNAVDAAAANSMRSPRVELTIDAGPAGHCIVVRDSGTGVAAADAERIFEPFVSGKANGMGVGLAISRAIAHAHGGTLVVVPGSEGCFRLDLPDAT